jgi:hypothetical protein
MTLAPRNVPAVVERLQSPDGSIAIDPASGVGDVKITGVASPTAFTLETALEASIALSADRVVTTNDVGQAVYADPFNPAHLDRAVWLTTAAIPPLVTGHVLAEGDASEVTWAWTPGTLLFLGAGGTLTETAPVGAVFWLPVAAVMTPTRIYFDPKIPIDLAA